jgi:hypothetical protein
MTRCCDPRCECHLHPLVRAGLAISRAERSAKELRRRHAELEKRHAALKAVVVDL